MRIAFCVWHSLSLLRRGVKSAGQYFCIKDKGLKHVHLQSRRGCPEHGTSDFAKDRRWNNRVDNLVTFYTSMILAMKH